MCGIVGAVATRDITPVLVEGLRRLEYRGYDSCGVALLADGALTRSRSTARVADLDAQVSKSKLAGTLSSHEGFTPEQRFFLSHAETWLSRSGLSFFGRGW